MPTVTKKAGGGVWCKQSFALYGVNDKSVLIDNPPFFCFYLTSLAHPSLPTAVWMDNKVWKRGMDVRKRWDWEKKRKRKIEWSHSHVVVYSTYEWSYWRIWDRVRKPHDGVIHLKWITDSVLLENTGWSIMELTQLIFPNLMDTPQLFLSHLMPEWCNSINIIPCSIA